MCLREAIKEDKEMTKCYIKTASHRFTLRSELGIETLTQLLRNDDGEVRSCARALQG